MAKVIPRNGLITIRFIRDDRPERKTSAGIFVPNTVAPGSDLFAEAEIIAVGRGIWDAGTHAMTDDLKPGMRVLVKSGMSGQRLGQKANNYVSIDVDGEETNIINQADIFAILEASPALALVN